MYPMDPHTLSEGTTGPAKGYIKDYKRVCNHLLKGYVDRVPGLRAVIIVGMICFGRPGDLGLEP